MLYCEVRLYIDIYYYVIHYSQCHYIFSSQNHTFGLSTFDDIPIKCPLCRQKQMKTNNNQ